MLCVCLTRTLVELVLQFLSLCCRMEGPTESKDSLLPGENGAKEPCIPQVSLQDIPDPSGTCLLPGVVVMTEPSPVHVGPSGSVAGTHIHNVSRPSAPSELCERLPCSSSTPCGAVREFPAADTLVAACSGRLSAIGHDRAYHHFLSLSWPLMPALG